MRKKSKAPVDISVHLSPSKQVWLYTYTYATNQGVALCDDCAAKDAHKHTLRKLTRVSLCNQCGYTDPETDVEDD